ncbi:MAG: rod shape-determining protein RodA [Rhodospirillaceae bacterium]|nr:rod shape-determining protein RodA [Rhodospirillaceae bacterium]MYB13115.1 rod shape-determining protein RodA [Rhodospirillaceae bacterium]MYI49308.1 rod shape-determining protein RodA [Rhodospirillaceae bacterium]
MQEMDLSRERTSPLRRLGAIDWGLTLSVCFAAAVGFVLLYSAAGGEFFPWAAAQMGRFGVALAVMIVTAAIPPRLWYRLAYWMWGLSVLLLLAAEFRGIEGGGAERWIALGPLRLQPSEVMKIALVVALAHYFHTVRFENVRRIRTLLPPLFLLLVPAALVLKQPDLGTTVILIAVAGVIFFLAGVRWWKFALFGAAAAAAVPLIWTYGLQAYQKQRLLTFLDPSSDPLGAGFHITQAKIALGSGGVFGKGFLNGTQIHLNFVPEMHTDFILAVLAEEFGLVGALALMAVYGLILYHLLAAALRAKTQFGRLVVSGVAFTFFLYAFINLAMVLGLLPVVGVPLPLVSYGGTSMLTLMFGFGLAMSAAQGGESAGEQLTEE